MNRTRVLFALATVLALSSQQPAVAQPSGRAALVKGKSLCLVERGTANCIKPGLGDVRLPLWSKDGEKVAFIESTPATLGLAMLRVVDRHGQSLLTLTIKPVVHGETSSGMRAVESLQWVDAHRIAVSGSVNPSSQETLVVDLQQGSISDEYIDDGGGLSFSPDGKHVAQLIGAPHFTATANRRPALRVDGSDVVLPSPVKAAGFGTPVWSADNRSIAIPMKDASGRDVLVHWQADRLRVIDLPAQATDGSARLDVFWSGSQLQLQRSPASEATPRPGAKTVPTEFWSLNPVAKSATWAKQSGAVERPAQREKVARSSVLKGLPPEFGPTTPDQVDVWCVDCRTEATPRKTGVITE